MSPNAGILGSGRAGTACSAKLTGARGRMTPRDSCRKMHGTGCVSGRRTTQNWYDAIRDCFRQQEREVVMIRLKPGRKYHIDHLRNVFRGWVRVKWTGVSCTGVEITNVEVLGYHLDDYFDAKGRYRGPDKYGVEPVFKDHAYTHTRKVAHHDRTSARFYGWTRAGSRPSPHKRRGMDS